MQYDFDYYEGIDLKYPQKPSKPTLGKKHDSIEDEAPDYTESCCLNLKSNHLQKRLEKLEEIIHRAKKGNQNE